jgi:hypothetical protein
MIGQKLIFFPLLAQVFLTFLVWCWMYKTRVDEMKRSRIKPQKLAAAADGVELLKSVSGPADNFKNLFEVPVLFYAAVITLYVTQLVDITFLTLAAVFVLFRYIHSFIHITYNHVMHRFYAYLASTFTIWIMWAMIGIRLMG